MLKYYVADAFADHVFEGNPAGVCILEEWLPEETMKNIAMENNLSETGFAVKRGDDPCSYELRWFTPTEEIDLCGHCTMGTAYILFRFYEIWWGIIIKTIPYGRLLSAEYRYRTAGRMQFL